MHCLLIISSLQHNEPVTTFYIRFDVEFSSKPILVGMASPVVEISLVFACLQNGQISLSDHGLLSIESKDRTAQKIHACRASCEMYANQFLWGCPLRFHRFLLLFIFGQIFVLCVFSSYFSYDMTSI